MSPAESLMDAFNEAAEKMPRTWWRPDPFAQNRTRLHLIVAWLLAWVCRATAGMAYRAHRWHDRAFAAYRDRAGGYGMWVIDCHPRSDDGAERMWWPT